MANSSNVEYSTPSIETRMSPGEMPAVNAGTVSRPSTSAMLPTSDVGSKRELPQTAKTSHRMRYASRKLSATPAKSTTAFSQNSFSRYVLPRSSGATSSKGFMPAIRT